MQSNAWDAECRMGIGFGWLVSGVRFTTVALFVLLMSPAGFTQEKKEPSRRERESASRDFAQCVEMEKIGDATSCWKLWLKNHEEAGSLAEVMLAREHAMRAATQPGSEAAVKHPDAIGPSSTAKLSQAATGQQEQHADPKSGPVKADAPAEPDGSDVAASKQHTPTDSPPNMGLDQKPQPMAAPALAHGEVLDFCALGARGDSERFVKQRLVIFAPAGLEDVGKNSNLAVFNQRHDLFSEFGSTIGLNWML